MEEELKQRSNILEKLLPNLFKAKSLPNQNLIKNILIHQDLALHPLKISSIKSIKVNVESVFEKYSPSIELPVKVATQKCILSQAIIKIPWTGECGHTFEESIILDYIMKNNKHCPLHGCGKPLIKAKHNSAK